MDWLFLEDPPEDADSWRKAMGSPQAPAVLDDAIATYADRRLDALKPPTPPPWRWPSATT